MDSTPVATVEYAKQAYWEERFKTEEQHEWFAHYSQFSHLLNPHLKPTDRILILGCGTSSLPTDLLHAGFNNVLATDASHTLIKKLQKKASASGVEYEVADMFELPYKNASFDVVIEKGTLDVIFTESKSMWTVPEEVSQKMKLACQQIYRVLKNEGSLFSITFTQPHFRQKFFDGHQWECKIKSFGDDAALEYFVYHLHKTPNCRTLLTPVLESGERIEGDCMHDYIDHETFLSNITL
eukprot:g5315.t1